MGDVWVHVVPRARTSEIVGRHGDAIRIRIAAPASNGAANAELVHLLARSLKVPASTVAITRGTTARRKRISIPDMTSSDIERTLLAAAVRG